MGSPWVNHVSPGAEIARSHVWHLHRLQHGRPGRTGPGLKVSRRSEQRQGLLMKPRFERLQRLGRCRPGWVLQNGTPWGPETAWFFYTCWKPCNGYIWLYLQLLWSLLPVWEIHNQTNNKQDPIPCLFLWFQAIFACQRWSAWMVVLLLLNRPSAERCKCLLHDAVYMERSNMLVNEECIVKNPSFRCRRSK